MAEYTVTIRDQADIDTLVEWAEDQNREPARHINHLIRDLMRQRRAAATKTPRTMGGARRGTRDKAA